MAVTPLQDISTDIVDITTDPSGGGGGGGGPFIKADGSISLTSDWNVGAFNVVSKNSEDCIYAGAAPYNVVANGSLTASGTGTDQTAAFLTALTAAVTAGKTLKLPSGIIKFTQNVTIPDIFGVTTNVHITIQGTGSPSFGTQIGAPAAQAGGTILKFWTGAGIHGITLAPTNSIPLFTLRNLEIQGPDSDVTATSGDGLHLVNPTNRTRIDFENVDVNHFRGGKGYSLNGCENGSGRNVSAEFCDVGFSFINATNANSIHNIQAQNCATRGIEVIGSLTLGFFGGLVQANEKTGVYVEGSEELGFSSFHFEGNNSTATVGSHGLHILSTVNTARVSAVKFSACRFTAAADDQLIDTSGTGQVFGTTFDTCRFVAVRPTLNTASVFNTLFLNSQSPGVDNGTATNVVSDVSTGNLDIGGKLGIGASPAASLDFGAGQDARLRWTGAGTLSGFGGVEATNVAGIGLSVASLEYQFNSSDAVTPYVRIRPGPLVGLGQTPTRTLDFAGTQRFRGIAAPAVSEIDSATLYYDSISDTLKCSQNGGAYVNVLGSAGLTGTGALNRVAVWDAATDVSSSAGLTFDGTTLGLTGNFNITSSTNVIQVAGAQAIRIDVPSNVVAIGGSNSATMDASNLAVGGHAMAAAIAGGTQNTAVGNFALQQLTNAVNNTAVGNGALSATTTGTDNVALGFDAGLSNITGSSNILIGSTSDVGATNLTNAIAIGLAAVISQSNSMQLGNAAMQVGIRTAGTPKTALDVGGSFALRKSAVAVVNGLNSNIAVTDFGYIRLTGPSAVFSLGGFVGGTDGRMLFLYNTVAFAMTIVNEDASSTAINRIKTLTGGNVTLRAGTSAVTLIYDTTDNRWVLLGTN